MIIVDNALKRREQEHNPVKVGIVGAGFIGRGATLSIERHTPGMTCSVLYNRSISRAKKAYKEAGIDSFKRAENAHEIDQIIEDGGYAVTDNPSALCQSKLLDVIIEATGEVEFGARVTMEAIKNKKHVVLMNAELDATLGPVLKTYADQMGVVLTNADGDQPGVIMNLLRFIETIGYQPVLAGNIKGLEDPYRTPRTQQGFAEKHNQSPKMCTSFADGTKLCLEMAIVSNATGFKTTQRGMYGPRCNHVKEALDLMPQEAMLNGGIVDYVLGAEPGPGVFVIGYNDEPILKEYMTYLKMGDGPFYLFYVPYHLPHLEVPISAARAVLFNDAVIRPLEGPVCDVVTIAKKDLKTGDALDGIGGFTCYGTIENSDLARKQNLLPIGLAENCIMKKDISRDQPITFDDVERPSNRISDKLWEEQMDRFF